MRNLKKLLALVLALVMALSVMVTVNAADLKPDADIKDSYREAVDVLAELDLIKGGSGNVYKPLGTITRAEFATMLYRAVTGDVDDAAPVLTEMGNYSGFTDVPAGSWYAGTVNYVSSEGLMVGTGGGRFNPNAAITGYEALVSLLRALGYDKMNEFTGNSQWRTNAAIYGSRYGVSEKVTEALSAQATRQEIAQMVFNTLTRATPVVFVPDTGGYANSSTNGVVTMGELNFNGLHKYGTKEDEEDETKKSAAADPFGRPGGGNWVWSDEDGKDVFFGADAPEPVAVFKGVDFTEDALNALKIKNNADVLYNGGKEGTGTTFRYGNVVTDKKLCKIPGYEWEFYDTDGDGEIDLILAIEPMTVIVVSKDEANESVTLDVRDGGLYYTGASKNDVQSKAKDFVVSNTNAPDAYTLVSGYEPGDIFMGFFRPGWIDASKNPKPTKLAAVDNPTTVSGTVTSISADKYYNGTVTVGGTTYTFANEYSQTELTYGSGTTSGTFYLYDGYVYHFVKDAEAPATVNFGVVLDVAEGTSSTGFAKPVFVKLLDLNGSVSEVQVSNAKSAADGFKGCFVTYTEKNGVYTLSNSNASDQSYTLVKGDDTGSNKNFSTEKGKISVTMNNSSHSTLTANNKSVVLVKSGSDDSPVYTVYTGYREMPTMNGSDIDGSNYKVTAAVVGPNDVLFALYVDTTNPSAQITVTDSAESKGLVYIVHNSSATPTEDATGKYYTFQAVVDGTIETLKIRWDDPSSGTLFGSSSGKLKDLVASSGAKDVIVTGVTVSGGLVTDITAASSGNYTVASSAGVTQGADGTMTLGDATFGYGDDCKVFVIDSGGSITEKTPETIATDTSAYAAYVKDTSDILTTVFVMPDESKPADTD